MSAIINFVDRPRELKFTLSAQRLFRAANDGEPLWKTRFNDENGLSKLLDAEIMVRIVWAGLLWENKKLTELQVEELLEKYIEAHRDESSPLGPVYTAIGEAFEASGLFGLRLPKGDKGEGDEAKDPKDTPPNG